MVKRQETLNSLAGIKTSSLEKLWAETKIGNIFPWDEIADEAERILESDQATQRVPDYNQADKEQEDDQEVDRDDTDTYNETIFGRRRLEVFDEDVVLSPCTGFPALPVISPLIRCALEV